MSQLDIRFSSNRSIRGSKMGLLRKSAVIFGYHGRRHTLNTAGARKYGAALGTVSTREQKSIRSNDREARASTNRMKASSVEYSPECSNIIWSRTRPRRMKHSL